MNERVEIGILGASGYTGAETIRLLQDHPSARIRWLTADRNAGQPVAALFPHLAHLDLPRLDRLEDVDPGSVDAIFCCLPHGLTQETVKALPPGPRIIDLSADFRLRDPELYGRVYGSPHRAPELQAIAVYGLSEHYRAAIRGTRLVANPGCYTTTAELPLIPLLERSLIDPDRITIDAKSGVSGAGRAAKESSLHSEVSEGTQAYGVGTHRHTPEIEQCLGDFAGQPMRVTFTPHLIPMNRGIFATIYVDLASGTTPPYIHDALTAAYRDEAFVKVLDFRATPSTRHLRGTNLSLIAVHPDRIEGRAILLAVTDNLVKGASGQAVQNMNIMLGLDEATGLRQTPIFP